MELLTKKKRLVEKRDIPKFFQCTQKNQCRHIFCVFYCYVQSLLTTSKRYILATLNTKLSSFVTATNVFPQLLQFCGNIFQKFLLSVSIFCNYHPSYSLFLELLRFLISFCFSHTLFLGLFQGAVTRSFQNWKKQKNNVAKFSRSAKYPCGEI